MRLIDVDEVIRIIEFEDKWLFDAKSNNANTDIAFNAMITTIKALSTVQAIPLSELQAIINSGLYEEDVIRYKMICALVNLYADMRGDTE